jgi:small-conductance mechanosensitive channel
MAAMMGWNIVAAAEATGVYATDLATVYGGYQRLLAMKEACDAAQPASRPANDRAFAAWEAQNRALIQELQRRVTAMIRLASQDEKDYARNLGKYEGAILQERQEYRGTLLGLGADELRAQCQRMPEMLRGPAADFGKVYAAELVVIRKRK